MTDFCPQCSNMLYETVEDDKLLHACKSCDYTSDSILSSSRPSATVYTKFYSQEFLTDSFATNPYTHLDPTLPRLNNKPCVNKSCETHTEKGLFECKYISMEDFQKEFPTIEMRKVKDLNTFTDHWLGSSPDTLFPDIFKTHTDLHSRKKTITEYRIDYICKPYVNDVIYIKYDDINMKYMYICSCCKHSWKNN